MEEFDIILLCLAGLTIFFVYVLYKFSNFFDILFGNKETRIQLTPIPERNFIINEKELFKRKKIRDCFNNCLDRTLIEVDKDKSIYILFYDIFYNILSELEPEYPNKDELKNKIFELNWEKFKTIFESNYDMVRIIESIRYKAKTVLINQQDVIKNPMALLIEISKKFNLINNIYKSMPVKKNDLLFKFLPINLNNSFSGSLKLKEIDSIVKELIRMDIGDSITLPEFTEYELIYIDGNYEDDKIKYNIKFAEKLIEIFNMNYPIIFKEDKKT